MLYHRLLLLHLLLLTIASTPTQGAVFVEGHCYRDDLASPTVTVSGGHYDPEGLLPDICTKICGRLDYIYSAIDEGKYCFCMDNIDVTATSPKETECEGLTPGLIQVWKAPGELSFTINADTFNFIVGETLNLTVTAKETWMIEWGDGSGHNRNGTQHIYTMPGEFVIVAFLELVPTVKDGIRVIVLEAPNATLECPDLVTVGEDAECHLITSTQGYDNVITAAFSAPDIPIFTYHVPGERTQGYGSVQGSASLNSSVSLKISQAIILHSNGVRAGYLSRIHLTAQTAGSVALYVR
ncbi:uncharacterized protein [Panulirus ornatus]|uniref:uncharacterized protein n=1 Tax=Panulirus ornatus TaxID=150431 RepID=UPI003A8412F7